MKMKLLIANALLVLSTFSANAALIISNESIDTNSISFDVSGTIEGPTPQSGLAWLFFVDTNRANGWISASNTATITSNIMVNGSPNSVDDFWVETDFGFSSHDRLTLNNNSNWSVGDILSGTFSATWANAINLDDFNGLDIYWGRDSSGYDESNGTFQGSFLANSQPIPNPPSLALLILGFMAMRWTSKKKQG
ncbi:hypothetical protein OAP14_02820 [Aliiglaciecola sp.]|nr:hypothetical protein [Aliiglaciecola sp.]